MKKSQVLKNKTSTLKLLSTTIKKHCYNWLDNIFLFIYYYLIWKFIINHFFDLHPLIKHFMGDNAFTYSYHSYLIATLINNTVYIILSIIIPIILVYNYHFIKREIKNNLIRNMITVAIMLFPTMILELYEIIPSLFTIINIIIIIFFLLGENSHHPLLKKIFKFIFISILTIVSILLIILISLVAISFGPGGYQGCGQDFHQSFIQHAQANDPSLCFAIPDNIHIYRSNKIGPCCYLTPEKYEYLITIRKDALNDDFTSSCLTAFALYTNDPSHCDRLLGIPCDFYPSLAHDSSYCNLHLNRKKNECLTDYAMKKNQAEICNLITFEDEEYDTGQESCRSSVRNYNN